MAIQIPAAVTETAIVTIARLYPHVDNIADWQAQQSIRLAWDRVHDLEERVTAAESTIDALISTLNLLLTATSAVQILAEQAYAKTQQP